MKKDLVEKYVSHSTRFADIAWLWDLHLVLADFYKCNKSDVWHIQH